MDQYGLPLMPVEVPVEPAEVPAQTTATFETMVTLEERPAGYSIKFKLADGPFVPHRDERAATISIPAGTP
jgi:hypothetical protein